MTRNRSRSPEDAAELTKLAEALGAVDVVHFGGKSYTVDDLLEAGLLSKLGKNNTPGLRERVKVAIAGRFRTAFQGRVTEATTRAERSETKAREATAAATRLRGELSLAQRAGALKPQEVSYIRTLVTYGMTPADVAKTMGIDVDTVRDLVNPKAKSFSWTDWAKRRDTRKGRQLEL